MSITQIFGQISEFAAVGSFVIVDCAEVDKIQMIHNEKSCRRRNDKLHLCHLTIVLKRRQKARRF